MACEVAVACCFAARQIVRAYLLRCLQLACMLLLPSHVQVFVHRRPCRDCLTLGNTRAQHLINLVLHVRIPACSVLVVVLKQRMVCMRRVVLKVPPQAAGGAKFVLAVCPPDVDASRAAQDGNSLLLRLQSEAEVGAASGHGRL